MPAPYTDIRANLPLQIALYFNGYYSAAFFVVTLLLFIYKGCVCMAYIISYNTIFMLLSLFLYCLGVMLPFPTAAIGLEVAFVFAWAILEFSRIYLGIVFGIRQ